ncbi:unnamed protein product [Adineta steineri]|uniref:PNPLA domain-containing protein n=1 Tax=Adineta steineri TaxID=433720 RepID=A0A813W0W2_9BILA|nr:unnamed protein product [Adineta steineri]CAF4030755.1 unnamed protein product [Adineta steineri]
MAAVDWNAKETRTCTNSNESEYVFFSFIQQRTRRYEIIDEYELSFLSALKSIFNKDVKSIDSTDAFKVYLQYQLIIWIDQQMTTLLSKMAEQTMEDAYYICRDDLRIANNAIQRRYQQLTSTAIYDSRTKERYSSVIIPIITNHKKIFSGEIKALLGVSTVALVILVEWISDWFKGYTEEQIGSNPQKFNREVAERLYQRISDKLTDKNEEKKFVDNLTKNPLISLGNIVADFERAFVDIGQLSQLPETRENVVEWKKARNLSLQSLKIEQLKIEEQIPIYRSSFDGSVCTHNYGVHNAVEVNRINTKSFAKPPVKYGLLSIDGGGTRGIIPAAIIKFLEQKAGRDFYELFDVAAGCSTGGILVLASMLRKAKGTELVELYLSLAKEVFSSQRRLPTTGYPVEKLEKLLENEFGNMTMNPDSFGPKTFVVAKRDREVKPFLIRNYYVSSSKHQGTVGWKCSDAARATTAAPTYFKPFRKDNHVYTDGGIGFNNPVELLYHEALAPLTSIAKMEAVAINECSIAYIVSLGTGKMPNLPPTNPNVLSPIRVMNNIYEIVEQASDSENAHRRMKDTCHRLNIPYFRFNPELPQRALLTETAPLNDWYEKTKTYMNDNIGQINQLCELFSNKKCSTFCKPCHT